MKWVLGEQGKLHLYLQMISIAHLTTWAQPPVIFVAALDSHRSMNPTVNCAYKGSRLPAPSDNHPETITYHHQSPRPHPTLAQTVEKSFSTKLVPSVRTVGNHCCREFKHRLSKPDRTEIIIGLISCCPAGPEFVNGAQLPIQVFGKIM